ncbi:10460_t:CDS:2, partial [Funneliformis geosporum]
DEYKYIQIMVEKELATLAHPVFHELLYASQKFIRKVEKPYSVSLRDVKRAITLVKFFYKSLENRPVYIKGYKYPPSGNPTARTRSYILALSLCYHSRLYDQKLRRQYRREMGEILQSHNAFVGEHMFAKVIREEQEDYINRMQCPPNTAKNEALLENVLVMIVCILTRIPLFLIGAPGYVSPSFKCILVMDEKNLALADPAFLNRFEKHKMSIHDTLNDRHKLLVENLSNWARQISTLIGVNQIAHLYEKFTQKDLFIGFDKDEVIQSLVFDVTKSNPKAENEKILKICRESLIALISPGAILRAEYSIFDRDEIIRLKHKRVSHGLKNIPDELSQHKLISKSIKVIHAQDDQFIDYEWNDNILKYSQWNPKIEPNTNFIFDLRKIEEKLAKKLVFEKVRFETEDDDFYLKKFSFKHELFNNSPRILFDIKRLLTQEPIPEDKSQLIFAMFQPSNSSFILRNSLNLSELHFLLNLILCFIKELSIKNRDVLIIDFVNQWLKLARYDITYINIFNEFSLKYIVALYEIIEEQVTNLIIHDLEDKFKDSLTQLMKDSIDNCVNYLPEQESQLIPAEALTLSLKRFIYRFLLVESNIADLNLSMYFFDFTLDLWTSDIKQELVERLFPTCLLVSHAYDSYIYIVNEVEKAMVDKQINQNLSTVSSTRRTLQRIKKVKTVTE